MSVGIWQILVILLIVVVLFGYKRLPEIGGGLGKAVRNFKKGFSEPDEIDITNKTGSTGPDKNSAGEPDKKE